MPARLDGLSGELMEGLGVVSGEDVKLEGAPGKFGCGVRGKWGRYVFLSTEWGIVGSGWHRANGHWSVFVCG